MQSSCLQVVYKESDFKNFTEFTGKRPCQILYGTESHWSFLWILRTPILWNISKRMLLKNRSIKSNNTLSKILILFMQKSWLYDYRNNLCKNIYEVMLILVLWIKLDIIRILWDLHLLNFCTYFAHIVQSI